jgi:hypothetical protein
MTQGRVSAPVQRGCFRIDYSQVTFPTAAELGEKLGTSNVDVTGNTVKVTGTAASITGTVQVANGITLEVLTGATLSVAGTLNVAGELKVAGTVTVAGTVDVTEGTLTKETGGTITATGSGQIKGIKTYSLTDNDGNTAVSGTTTYLDAASVLTVDANGKQLVTITVKSKTGQKVPAPASGVWGNAGDGKPTGQFSDLALDMSAAVIDTSKTYAVKTTTLGLLYYDGDTYLYNNSTKPDGFVTTTEITAPQPEDKPDVYISEDKSVVFKWKKYGSSTTLIKNKNHGVLLYDGAATKTVTLDIAEVGDEDALTPVVTIVIDYSGVTFATGS